MKTAYEIRGWTIENMMTIEQCRNDEFVKELREHANEGCRVYGHVEVAKVSAGGRVRRRRGFSARATSTSRPACRSRPTGSTVS